MEGIKIKISTFSVAPGPRFRNLGSFSGEQFREDVLLPRFREALSKNAGLVIDLDGTRGYGQSFLEEAFGGLVREISDLDENEIFERMEFISNEEPYLIGDIRKMMLNARPVLAAA